LRIDKEVSKQGKVKPVILLEPTAVSGVTVEKITAYNAKYAMVNCICPNAVIEFTRGGEVIPKHIKTVSFDKGSLRLEAEGWLYCPSCGSALLFDATQTERVCSNSNCDGIRKAKIIHFFNTMDVSDFGPATIELLYDAGYDTFTKIAEIDHDSFVKLGGLGAAKYKKLKDGLKALDYKYPLARYLHAIDVMDGLIGEKVIQSILDAGTEAKPFITNLEELNLIDGVAEKTAKVWVKGIGRYLNHYKGRIEVFHPEPMHISTPKVEGILTGEKICFTGCRPSYEESNRVTQLGGVTVSGVSGKTTILVVSDLSSKTLSSQKAKKAKTFGIKIIPYSQFKSIISNDTDN